MDAIELVWDAKTLLGECPTWDPRTGELLWLDLRRAQLLLFDPGTGDRSSLSLPRTISAIAPRRHQPGLVAAGGTSFYLLVGTELQAEVPVGEAIRDECRFNDGTCDTAGRFLAGTVAPPGRPRTGALYQIGADLRPVRMVDRVDMSNGIGWSPEGQLMYYVDTATQGVQAFEYDQDGGRIGRKRKFVEVPRTDGQPDGLAVDDEGGVWLALWGGSAVRRYRPDGALDRVLTFPASQVSSCAFGGPDLRDLYVTTANVGLSADEIRSQRGAGGLFRVRVDVPGTPAALFEG